MGEAGRSVKRLALRVRWTALGFPCPISIASCSFPVPACLPACPPFSPTHLTQVVDMFGCGLPVCALTYSCIGELVSHEHNGLLFATPEQLAQQLLDVFRGFEPAAVTAAPPQQQQRGSSGSTPGKAAAGGLLAQLRRGVAGSSMARWHDSWQKTVLPVLEGAASA